MTKERARANTTGLSRRNLLAALPASGLAAVLPQVAPAETPDPVVVAYRQWLAARREWRELSDLPGNGNWDDPRSIDAEKREDSAVERMFQATPTTLEGIGALAAVAWSEFRPQTLDPEEFKRRANAQDCQVVLAIWRACTGQEGYPDV